MLHEVMPVLTLAGADEAIPIVAVGGGLLVAIVAIVFGNIKSMVQTKAREETRRELAAYVAEGTMSPQDAQRILEAGMKAWEKERHA